MRHVTWSGLRAIPIRMPSQQRSSRAARRRLSRSVASLADRTHDTPSASRRRSSTVPSSRARKSSVLRWRSEGGSVQTAPLRPTAAEARLRLRRVMRTTPSAPAATTIAPASAEGRRAAANDAPPRSPISGAAQHAAQPSAAQPRIRPEPRKAASSLLTPVDRRQKSMPTIGGSWPPVTFVRSGVTSGLLPPIASRGPESRPARGRAGG